MAFESFGYGDAMIGETIWAQIMGFVGSRYAVGGPQDLLVAPVAGNPGVLSVNPGWVYGHGVLDHLAAQDTVTCPIPTSGSSWSFVCVHRTWTPNPGGLTTLKVMPAAAAAVPSNRDAVPGTSDDQPLALAQFTAGQSMPTRLIDLRHFPSKVIGVESVEAIIDPRRGEVFQLPNGDRYRAILSGSGTIVTEKESTGQRIARGVVPGGWMTNQYSSFRVQHNLGWVPTFFTALYGFASKDLYNAIQILPIYAGDAAPTTTQFSVWVIGQAGAAAIMPNQQFGQPLPWMAME